MVSSDGTLRHSWSAEFNMLSQWTPVKMLMNSECKFPKKIRKYKVFSTIIGSFGETGHIPVDCVYVSNVTSSVFFQASIQFPSVNAKWAAWIDVHPKNVYFSKLINTLADFVH